MADHLEAAVEEVSPEAAVEVVSPEAAAEAPQEAVPEAVEVLQEVAEAVPEAVLAVAPRLLSNPTDTMVSTSPEARRTCL